MKIEKIHEEYSRMNREISDHFQWLLVHYSKQFELSFLGELHLLHRFPSLVSYDQVSLAVSVPIPRTVIRIYNTRIIPIIYSTNTLDDRLLLQAKVFSLLALTEVHVEIMNVLTMAKPSLRIQTSLP